MRPAPPAPRVCRAPIALALALLLAAGCATAPASGTTAARRATHLTTLMINDDVQWEESSLGLHPRFSGKHLRELRALGPQANPALLKALQDPERFAAAHVLLTTINLTRYSFSASEWNGLHVTRVAGGLGRYQAQDLAGLCEAWEKRFGLAP